MKTLEMLAKLGKVEIKAIPVHDQFTVDLSVGNTHWRGFGASLNEAAEEVISGFRRDKENQRKFRALRLCHRQGNLANTLHLFSVLGDVVIRRGEDEPVVVALSNCGDWEEELEDFQFAATSVYDALELMQTALKKNIDSQTCIGRFYRAMVEEK